MTRTEFITRGDCDAVELGPGFHVRVMVAGAKGARGLTTCLAEAAPQAALQCHTHPTGESITLVSGVAHVLVENRRYRLEAFDSIHVPAGVPHGVRNDSTEVAVMHTSFPTDKPEREFVDEPTDLIDCDTSDNLVPETLVRFADAERYAVGEGNLACDLFAGRLGSQGMCGGHAVFEPGCALPCHTHEYDESITIIGGKAVAQVAGQQYEMSDNDTACVPQGRPHRFWNAGDEPMSMIWVYAGDEPDRQLVDQCCCEGEEIG